MCQENLSPGTPAGWGPPAALGRGCAGLSCARGCQEGPSTFLPQRPPWAVPSDPLSPGAQPGRCCSPQQCHLSSVTPQARPAVPSQGRLGVCAGSADTSKLQEKGRTLGCSLLSPEPSPGVAARGLALSCTLLSKGRAALSSPVFPFKPQQQWNIYELFAEMSRRASSCTNTLSEQRAGRVTLCDSCSECCVQWLQTPVTFPCPHSQTGIDHHRSTRSIPTLSPASAGPWGSARPGGAGGWAAAAPHPRQALPPLPGSLQGSGTQCSPWLWAVKDGILKRFQSQTVTFCISLNAFSVLFSCLAARLTLLGCGDEGEAT